MMLKIVKTTLANRLVTVASAGHFRWRLVAERRRANGNAAAGITVEEGSSNNQITNMSSAGNGGQFDLIDNNPNCDGDLWFNNAFGDASQSCIH